ncbi:MAG: MFS transporter [Clostridia bacterium]|nr:MFS transporter [Clostridia bacterium]
MSYEISKRAKAIAWLLTLVYFASYLMRKNFSVMMANICIELGVADSALGIVASALTITYGAGQVINGIIGDKIKPQLMLTIGLALAAVCNVAMFLIPTSIPAMAAVWAINGYAHAMLWPPIVRLMSMYMNSTEYGYSAVRVSWGSSIGTIVLYLGAPFLLRVMNWRSIILICAAGGVAILGAWLVLQRRFFSETPELSVPVDDNKKAEKKKGGIPLPAYVFIPVALIMLGIILQGMLRDGVNDWAPSFLSATYGVDEENAILFTVVPAIFSMISFSVFDLLHRKVFKNEVTCSAVIFGGAAVFAIILYLFNSFLPNIVLAIAMVSLIIGCMHGINLMLITVVPKRFIKSGKVSTFSGILNACTYIGASVAVPGFAMLKEAFNNDWNVAVLAWGIIATLGVAACICAVPLWRKFRKEYAD